MTAKELADRAERLRYRRLGLGLGPRDGKGPRRGARRVAKISGPRGSITKVS